MTRLASRARRAEKERQRQAKQQAAEAAASPTQARRFIVIGRPGGVESLLRFVVGIAGRVRLQPEFVANVGILLGVERSPVLGEQA
jgi:hypothetical protein